MALQHDGQGEPKAEGIRDTKIGILVAVGSTNPVKINAAEAAFTEAFGNVRISKLKTRSGVSEMPMSSSETRRGAENRAKEAIKKTGADFGVGMEGGVEKTGAELMLCSYVAVVDGDGRIGIGGGTSISIPEYIAKRIREGEELKDIADNVFGVKNANMKTGAIGLLTKELTNREEMFKILCFYALAPFLRPELYRKNL